MTKMSRTRLIVLFILLVLILVAASVLFGLLTYGLDGERASESVPGAQSAEQVPAAALAARSCLDQPAGI